MNQILLTEDPSKTSRAGGEIVRALFAALERDCDAYCVLAGFDCLPNNPSSDIDFMVSNADFKKLPAILKRVADETRVPLVQTLQHESSACFYVFARVDGNSTVRFLQADAAGDYKRNGRLFMKADDVLARRRRHSRGFWIPSAADAFEYYLVKRIDKRNFSRAHGAYLSSLYAEDPIGCQAVVSLLWPASLSATVRLAAVRNDWDPVICLTNELALTLAGSKTLKSRLREASRKLSRVTAPTGLFVAFLGPDGVGKSSVINGVESRLRYCFRSTKLCHLRPNVLKGTSAARTVNKEPHSKPNRGAFLSIIKLGFLFTDYVLGYWLQIRPMLVRSTLVVFDRYFYDLEADPKRFRYGGPGWLAKVLCKVMPAPDMIVVLDAPTEVVRGRKQELSKAEIERQLQVYSAMQRGPDSGRVRVIDASKPVEDVIAQSCREILAYLESRTVERTGVA